ncbi:MAG: glycosyltransferase [Prevotellaceae bacterium]|jgi:glycosyltransferase involved in cell wall biosynthesis|nr:glycosyltransferase [Prevotellaceae bacterium]
MEKQNTPFISVLIPTYNNGQFIKEAIDSVFAQQYDNLEIIVVDDGSTDNTKEIVERYPSIKYFYQENSGVSAARNLCLEHARGEYIAWLDADDYWLSGKLYAQVEYFNEHSDCQIVFTKFANFFENEDLKSNPIAVQEFEIAKKDKHYLPSALIKKDIFEKFGNFKTELIIGEDLDFLYRLISVGVDLSHLLDNIYYHRRLHGANITLLQKPLSSDQYFNQLLIPNLIDKARASVSACFLPKT